MSTTLSTLLRHAERQRDEGLAALARAEDLAARMVAQTGQLLAYRDDYRLRNPALGGHSASIELLRCHQGFMQRLEHAISHQQAQQQQAESTVLQQRALVQELRIRAAAVRKLVERRDAELRQREARQEQRRSDETAAQRSGTQALPRGTSHAALAWQHSTQAMPL